MTDERMDKITDKVMDIFRHAEFYDCVFCSNSDCFKCEKNGTVYDLLEVIASLHNELYKEVKGDYYNYVYHWANLGYGGSPDDHIFDDKEEAK